MNSLLKAIPVSAHVLSIILILFISCGGGFAHADEWKKADTYREAVYLVLHVVDWNQTLYISDHPNEYRERNGIIGDHPSRGRVNAYFIATGLLHPAISYGLKKYAPDGWSEAWQWVTIGVEAVTNP